MRTANYRTPLRILTCLAAVAIFLLSSSYMWRPAASAAVDISSDTKTEKPRLKEFPHSAKAHRMDCKTCHKFPSDNWNKVRTGAAAFPDVTEYPKHDSCLKCHMQQFFRGATPTICSVCHTNPGPRNSNRHPFPNPREIYDASPKGKIATSDFVVGFPHDKHIEIVSGTGTNGVSFVNASFSGTGKRFAAEESCAVCHQTMAPQGKSDDEYLTKPPDKLGDAFWLKKGTFKSAPLGHTKCFECHNADSGLAPAPSDCGMCHKLKPVWPKTDFDAKVAATMIVDNKPMLDAWSRRTSAGKFQHEYAAHVDMPCSTCHDVVKMNTADPLTRKVSIDACATCHATPTLDDGGAINYEVDQRKKDAAFQCVKCHITFGKLPVPQSHIKAVTPAAGK